MKETNENQLSADAVLNALTNDGRDTIELCFVLNRVINRWEPNAGLFMGYMIDESHLANACRTYLRKKGLEFDNAEALVQWAKSHNWPNVDKLRRILGCGDN